MNSRSKTCIRRLIHGIDKVAICCHHAIVDVITVSASVDQEPRPTEHRGHSNQKHKNRSEYNSSALLLVIVAGAPCFSSTTTAHGQHTAIFKMMGGLNHFGSRRIVCVLTPGIALFQ
jgi:hypothetical protein